MLSFNIAGILLMLRTSMGEAEISFESHSCRHSHDTTQVIYDVELEASHVIQKRSADQNIRIHLHFADSIEALPYSHRQLVKDKVWEAVAFWEDTLLLRPTNVPIRLNRRCVGTEVRYSGGVRYCRDGCTPVTLCGDVQVPNDHLHSCEWWDSRTNQYHSPSSTSPGVVNYDYILYVTAMSTERCLYDRTVAFAAHCQQEKALDRPVAGYISICPSSISTSSHKHEELLYTIKHEILHALGFTAGLYAFYRDGLGQPLTTRDPTSNKPTVFNHGLGMYQWSARVVREVTRYNWRLKGQTIHKTAYIIVTPNVVRETRRHFNCATLEGAELEDQGANGTALTHWEKRVFENEFMTGTYTQNPIISRITLALMEDTGWYKVRYENAGSLEWGRNLGCGFVQTSCYEWIETRLNRGEDIHPFCIKAKRGQTVTECSGDHKAVAVCNLSEYKTKLPTQYQYFRSIPGVSPSDVARYGGGVSLADYCPYLQEFVWKDPDTQDILRGSRCALVQNRVDPRENYLLESYGPQSMCFSHASPWQLQQCRTVFMPHSGSGCYQYECRSDTGLTIYVDGQSYICDHSGQTLHVFHTDHSWLYNGNITCPACTDVCRDQQVTCPVERRPSYTVGDRYKKPNYIPCGSAASLHVPLSLLYMLLCFICFL